jgi:hypothetical protein
VRWSLQVSLLSGSSWPRFLGNMSFANLEDEQV